MIWINVEDALPKNRDPVMAWVIAESKREEYRVVVFNPYTGWELHLREKVAKWFPFDFIGDEEKKRVLTEIK